MLKWSNNLFPLFLGSISSETYKNMSESVLQNELNNIALRAINKFAFPKKSLEYSFEQNSCDRNYFFIGDVSGREIEVIVAWMEYFWFSRQLSQESLFMEEYADRDMKVPNGGGLISSITRAVKFAKENAIETENGYYKINANGEPSAGDINA